MDDIKKAINIVKEGGIIIFPTDTAFGIGCRIDNEAAIKHLFGLRKRPETQATPVLVSGLEMAQAYLKPISQEVIDTLITPYWPGALTLVLPCKTEIIPGLVRGGGDTLGVRKPNHPTALALIEGVGIPLLGPSANFHGEKTPYSYEDLDPALISQVDYVLSGECDLKQASTVLDATQKPWKILRQGAVKVSF